MTLEVFREHAGPRGDDHGGLGRLHLLAQHLEKAGQFVRIDHADALGPHAERFDEPGEIQARGRRAIHLAPGARVVLASGHRRGAVIEQQHRDVAPVIGDVGERRHSRVQERRVANHREHGLGSAIALERFRHAVRDAERCPHRDDRVHRVPGRTAAERVTADIAADDRVLESAEPEVHPGVGAAGAERGRARKDACLPPYRFVRRGDSEQPAGGALKHGHGDLAL